MRTIPIHNSSQPDATSAETIAARGVMIAMPATVDGAFWIGPACEIEGCP